MLEEILLVLKKDLSFPLSKEEKKKVEEMSELDFQKLRIYLLEKVKAGEIEFEELEEILEMEKNLCLHDFKGDLEGAVELEEQLDRNCSKFLIDGIAKQGANAFHLLGTQTEELELARVK